MFVGHTAVALAAKSRAREVSLGWLLAAAVALDLIWPVLLLLDVEHVRISPGFTAFTPFDFQSYPYSHSLLMSVVWAAAAALLARWRGLSQSTAVLIGGLVLSHWVLDFVTHAPDLPLVPWASPRVGLGLWNSIAATFVVEGALFVAGIALYLRATRARDRIGVWALWSLLGVSVVMWASGPFSSPPPSERAIGWVTLGLWLLVAWAAWADRHRDVRHS